jgi:hypothetical protein
MIAIYNSGVTQPIEVPFALLPSDLVEEASHLWKHMPDPDIAESISRQYDGQGPRLTTTNANA